MTPNQIIAEITASPLKRPWRRLTVEQKRDALSRLEREHRERRHIDESQTAAEIARARHNKLF